MKNTHLYSLCSTFERKEVEKAQAYLKYFTDASPKSLRLFDEIAKAYKKAKYNWEHTLLDKAILNQSLFGSKEDNKTARALRSELYKCLKEYAEFLAFQERKKVESQHFLLDYSLNYNLTDLFEGEYKKKTQEIQLICRCEHLKRTIRNIRKTHKVFTKRPK